MFPAYIPSDNPLGHDPTQHYLRSTSTSSEIHQWLNISPSPRSVSLMDLKLMIVGFAYSIGDTISSHRHHNPASILTAELLVIFHCFQSILSSTFPISRFLLIDLRLISGFIIHIQNLFLSPVCRRHTHSTNHSFRHLVNGYLYLGCRTQGNSW